jgi:DNA excision repair protein ERCC-2
MRSLLGLDDDVVCRRMASPFSPEQLQVRLALDVDTRYRQRQASLPLLVSQVSAWLQQQAGNCIVYFPSYRYLAEVAGHLGTVPGRHCWHQQPDQGDSAREQLLQLLEERRDVAAFCILGGVFGEGVDLPGERLASVVVVGVGLPQVNRDRELLRHWYQQRRGRGFEFAYLYPGMQKVAQALGRVVRSGSDRGSALLLDSRYGQGNYRDLLPPWWQYREVGS